MAFCGHCGAHALRLISGPTPGLERGPFRKGGGGCSHEERVVAWPLHMALANEAEPNDLETKVYEVSFITPSPAGEDAAREVFERVKNRVSALGGSVLAEGAPQRTQLASEMSRSVAGKREHHAEGFFSFVKFEAAATAAPELEAFVKQDGDIIRHLLITTVRDTGPAAHFLSSDRLEGETIRKKEVIESGKGPVSEEELDKSIEQLIGDKV